MWRKAAKVAGLPVGTGMHDLRHTYASLLIRKGLSVKVVQARLGHATAAETLDTYGHLWPEDEDRTREAVEVALSGLGSASTASRRIAFPKHRLTAQVQVDGQQVGAQRAQPLGRRPASTPAAPSRASASEPPIPSHHCSMP